jgi:hypothetical protein
VKARTGDPKEATVTRFTSVRHVAADPAGVALLLAEPTPWAEPDSYWTVGSPERSDDGFTADVQVAGSSGRSASGALTVTSSPVGGCDVRLVVTARNRAAARRLRSSALGFLGSLAERAQARSFAA